MPAWGVGAGSQGHQDQLLVPQHLRLVDEHHSEHLVPNHLLDSLEHHHLQVQKKAIDCYIVFIWN